MSVAEQVADFTGRARGNCRSPESETLTVKSVGATLRRRLTSERGARARRSRFPEASAARL